VSGSPQPDHGRDVILLGQDPISGSSSLTLFRKSGAAARTRRDAAGSADRIGFVFLSMIIAPASWGGRARRQHFEKRLAILIEQQPGSDPEMSLAMPRIRRE